MCRQEADYLIKELGFKFEAFFGPIVLHSANGDVDDPIFAMHKLRLMQLWPTLVEDGLRAAQFLLVLIVVIRVTMEIFFRIQASDSKPKSLASTYLAKTDGQKWDFAGHFVSTIYAVYLLHLVNLAV